ncbi:MAG: hypothetical protein HZC55_01705 [Verrucomicrobia bacterium]|nr:hypothetical protein [Verrucomicrobiota bacterium]
MKRSRRVQRLLLGGFTAGLAGTCAAAAEPRITPENYYTNDTFIQGAGHYHAPFQGFYPLPYNHYDAQRGQYYYGGQWGPAPHRSIVNISTPTPSAAQAAQAARTDLPRSSTPVVVRDGFGSTSHSRFTSS